MGNDKIVPPEIVAAADWWASRAGSTRNKMDNMGDTAETSTELFPSLLATAMQSRNPEPADEQVILFKESLTMQLVELWNGGSGWMTLSVDYGPCRILSIAMEAAELTTILPWKTTMWIERGSVKVSEGYGAKHVDIYTK